jgi:hypothetical protein
MHESPPQRPNLGNSKLAIEFTTQLKHCPESFKFFDLISPNISDSQITPMPSFLPTSIKTIIDLYVYLQFTKHPKNIHKNFSEDEPTQPGFLYVLGKTNFHECQINLSKNDPRSIKISSQREIGLLKDFVSTNFAAIVHMSEGDYAERLQIFEGLTKKFEYLRRDREMDGNKENFFGLKNLFHNASKRFGEFYREVDESTEERKLAGLRKKLLR